MILEEQEDINSDDKQGSSFLEMRKFYAKNKEWRGFVNFPGGHYIEKIAKIVIYEKIKYVNKI